MHGEWEKARAASQTQQSSNKQFGLVMASFFVLVTALSAWKREGLPLLTWPAVSVGFAILALVIPKALSPLNQAWTLLGKALHKVMGPLVLGLMYFGFLTPLGLLFRWVKGDPLRLKIDKKCASYWIDRKDDDQPGGGMANQF